ncbi:MAG: hypothetical protein ACK514_09950 [Bacteroidota bacterium]|jgi:hypothetical protein|nr:hypothetical protein [Cytophagales bacterium]MCE2957387.1 hypothetical protein [Flammeovirgaceae bacterium]MCZ8068735.1 hypothetical protein [Cytophagales bacterium]
MKKNQILLVLAAIAVLFQISSCSSEKVDPTKDNFLNNLSRSWTVNNVQLDSKDVTNAFPGMVISFTKDGNFTTTNPVGNLWPASGTFTLQASTIQNLFDLTRNDGALVTLTQISSSALQFKMTFATAPGGRVSSVAGNYTFNMKAP